MKLQVTLALLCMAVCFNVVNCSLKCVKKTGQDSPSASLESATPCGEGIEACVMYKKGSTYNRECADNTHACSKLSLGTDDQCAQCNKDDCNKGTFTTCYEYNATDAANKGKQNICPSAICIMYKEGTNYIRGCTTTKGTCQAPSSGKSITLCAECNSENCNKGAFKTCHEYNGADAANTGKPNICPSDTCIMYKQGDNYIRGCVNDAISCSKLKATNATQCAECPGEKCNQAAFVTSEAASAFSLDIRMAAIGLASSLMILRSL